MLIVMTEIPMWHWGCTMIASVVLNEDYQPNILIPNFSVWNADLESCVSLVHSVLEISVWSLPYHFQVMMHVTFILFIKCQCYNISVQWKRQLLLLLIPTNICWNTRDPSLSFFIIHSSRCIHRCGILCSDYWELMTLFFSSIGHSTIHLLITVAIYSHMPFLTQALTNCLSASADFLDFLWWLDWTSELYRMVDLEMELVVVNWYLNLTHYSLLSYSPVGFPIINPETHMQLLMNCFNCA